MSRCAVVKSSILKRLGTWCPRDIVGTTDDLDDKIKNLEDLIATYTKSLTALRYQKSRKLRRAGLLRRYGLVRQL